MKRHLGLGLGIWLIAIPVFGLEIKEIRWGFDGKVVPERFNMLSVLVANSAFESFDGTLRLRKAMGLEQGVGADYAARCYVSPGRERWVQFYPYISGESQWRLVWGDRPTEARDLRPPELGPPARVLLSDTETAPAGRVALPVFPDQLFPTSVAATDGLDSLLLDYAPAWEPVRRIALLDWLRRGGAVHLLWGANGDYPVFAGELAVFNTSKERIRFGAGWIVRHPRTRQEVSAEQLEEAGFAAPRIAAGRKVAVRQLADTIFSLLARFARPKHPWWLINTLTICYIVAIGPGVFLMARRTRDYRLVLLALAGAVVVFCGLFGFFGRRGSAEQGAVHSLACARALGDGQYQVTQWINAFATRGADYTLTHAAPHNCYAVVQEYERVNGLIFGGKDGRFVVDIPFCSQRSFVHQARMPGPALGVEVVGLPGGQDFSRTVLTVGSEFPARPVAVWAAHSGTLWPMRLQGDRLLPAGAGTAITNILSGPGPSNVEPGAGPVGDARKREAFLRLAPYVIGWALGGTKQFHHYIERPLREDRLRLFVMAESPETFRLHGTPVGTETGYVIYDTDVLLELKGSL